MLEHAIYKLHNSCPAAINAVTVDYLSLLRCADTQVSTITVTLMVAVTEVRTEDIEQPSLTGCSVVTRTPALDG